MATPVEIIFAHKAEIDADEALKTAQRQLVDAYVRTYKQIASHVNEVAGLADRHGMAALLNGLPEPVAIAIGDSIQALRSLYASCSPYPFPELPDEPKATE